MFPVQTLYFERPTQTPRRPPVFRCRCRPRWALPASTSPTFRVHTDHNTSPTATLKHTLEFSSPHPAGRSPPSACESDTYKVVVGSTPAPSAEGSRHLSARGYSEKKRTPPRGGDASETSTRSQAPPAGTCRRSPRSTRASGRPPPEC